MLFLLRLMLARLLFHPLEGLSTRLLRDTLRAEHYRISPRYWPKLGLLTLESIWQSYFGHKTRERFGARIEAASVKAPVFILGHYRSGTTFLHELMALDSRYASPTRFQAYQAPSFLMTEAWFAWFSDLFMLPRRVQEDEIALMNLTGLSPYMAWCFPESERDYTRYTTFRRAEDREVETWQAALRWYLAALTIRHDKPLLLKSPPHTGRIRSILKVFPDARFVHIRRNPFDVYVSTVKLLQDLDPVFRLRVRRDLDPSPVVLDTYQEMYDAFFDDIDQIPSGQFVEIAYEDLEEHPVEQLQVIYDALNLGDFAPVEPIIRRYLQTIQGYQKNRHKQIDPATRERIITRWARSFDRWGYPRD